MPGPIENVRVLRLADGRSILFHSLRERVSVPLPGAAGRVVELVQAGVDFESAADSLLLSPQEGARLARLLADVAGDREDRPLGTALPAGVFRNLILLPSGDCNLRCRYCYASSGSGRMEVAVARAAIRYLADHSPEGEPLTLIFHGGGEPLTHFALVQEAVELFQDLARERGRETFLRVTTNGVYPESRARWVAERFDHVTLSLDGPPEIHDRQRPAVGGGGTYEDVVRSLEIYARAGILEYVIAVVTPEIVPRMEEIVRHMASLDGVRSVGLHPMCRCGRCGPSRIDALDAEAYLVHLKKARRLGRELGLEVVSFTEYTTNFTDHYCGGCGLNLAVGWNARVATCHEAFTEPAGHELYIGRVDGATGTVELDRERISALRGRTYERFETCRACVFRTNCAGGCPVRAARSNGTIWSVDAEWCGLVRGALEDLFREMAQRGE